MATHVLTKALSSYWKLCYCPSSLIYNVKGVKDVRFYGKLTKKERAELRKKNPEMGKLTDKVNNNNDDNYRLGSIGSLVGKPLLILHNEKG